MFLHQILRCQCRITAGCARLLYGFIQEEHDRSFIACYMKIDDVFKEFRDKNWNERGRGCPATESPYPAMGRRLRSALQ